MYKITKIFNVWTGTTEEVNIITDKKGIANLVVSGLEIEEYEKISKNA